MTCIIIEDEIPAQSILKNYINKIPDLTLIGVLILQLKRIIFLNLTPQT